MLPLQAPDVLRRDPGGQALDPELPLRVAPGQLGVIGQRLRVRGRDVQVAGVPGRDLLVPQELVQARPVEAPRQAVPVALVDGPGDPVDRAFEDLAGLDPGHPGTRILCQLQLLEQVGQIIRPTDLVARPGLRGQPEPPVPPPVAVPGVGDGDLRVAVGIFLADQPVQGRRHVDGDAPSRRPGGLRSAPGAGHSCGQQCGDEEAPGGASPRVVTHALALAP